ncbi:uncharacterized protein DMAD_00916 [Drosophila madeirensis]|uniref:Uncharacterized protein n=1 Tax=Drosophila madeirensis TaxID=30013 RepID=A0AAU9G079_DROMD
MDRLPAVIEHLGNMCASYPKIGQSMKEFEEALQKNKTLKSSVNRLQLQIEDQKVDAKLVGKAAQSMDECRAETELAARIATACYSSILAIENHMSDAQVQDVLRLTVHLKQGEVMAEIQGVEKRCGTVNESNATLESRSIVQEFRQLRRTMNEAADELLRNDREVQAMLLQWSSKIKSSTAYRNKKIVNVLKLRKEIHQLRDELVKPRQQRVEKWAKPADPCPSACSSIMAAASNLMLQSAMTFVTDFLNGPKASQIECGGGAQPLRSILLQGERKRAASPTKLVHFAASPVCSISSDDNVYGALGATFTQAIDDSLKEFDDLNAATPPKKGKVTKVEILPALDISSFQPHASGNANLKDFSNLFPSLESKEQQDIMDIDNEAASTSTKQHQPAVVSVEQEELLCVRPTTALSHQQDSIGMMATTSATSFQFSETNYDPNDDFMLNFSDDNHEDDTQNGYNL